MNIPNVPTGPLVTKDESPTTEWKLFFTQLIQVMQTALSDEGFHVPSQATGEIAKLTASPNATVIYDSTTNELMVRKAGTFKNILTA